jgi:methylenetetrahydrofolate--tRNA-(uracil-5-)-methyltransferase
MLAGRFAAAEAKGEPVVAPPATTALGALLAHITRGADAATFQPMNVNFGLFPPLDRRIKKTERRPAMARRALADLSAWLARTAQAA